MGNAPLDGETGEITAKSQVNCTLGLAIKKQRMKIMAKMGEKGRCRY
ncbi:MAG: hypothetical protein IKI64_05230 [Clostridia bacterium]|nr:hypothetical protein [Clostridia bacterium]